MEIIFLFLIAIVLIAGYQMFKYRKSQNVTDSISQPPPPPQVTPTVVMNNIIIGEAAYYDIESPELSVTIIEVDSDNVTLMNPDASITTLPVSNFLIRYAPRVQTKISKER